MPSRLLLLCLLLRTSWLTREGGRQISAAGLPHRRGGRAALAVSVSVAVGVPERQPGEHDRLLETSPFADSSGTLGDAPLCRSSRANPRVHGLPLPEANRGSALLKRSGTGSVLSPRGDEAPGHSGAVVTDLNTQPVRQGVDLDVILRRDSELCDQGQDRAN